MRGVKKSPAARKVAAVNDRVANCVFIMCVCLFGDLVLRSGSDHGQNHFEPVESLQGMWLTGGHQNHLAAIQTMRLARNGDLRFSFKNEYERIKRRGVFAQPLTVIEGEDRD